MGNWIKRVTLSPDQVKDRIFELVDENGDRELSLDEFMDGARRDKWVMNMLLQVDLNLKDWMQERQCSADF
ncbi:unnamed protein product [Lota lota]